MAALRRFMSEYQGLTKYATTFTKTPSRYVTIYLFIACTIQSTESSFFSHEDSLGLDNRHELDHDSEHFYKIVWKGSLDQNVNSVDGDQTQKKIRENNPQLYDDTIMIATNQNEQYQCIVPRLPGFNMDSSATNSSSKDDEDEKRNKSPYSLLEKLFSRRYCSVKYEQYWIYELCHGSHLRQYHVSDPTRTLSVEQEYFLGRFQTSELKAYEEEYEKQMLEYRTNGGVRPTISIEGHNRPYLMVTMSFGTQCDLTNKSRVSKVFYVCSEEHKHELYSIKETSTCEYEAIVLSPLLCYHEDFKINTSVEHEIECFSLDKSRVKPKALERIDKEEQKSSTQGKFAFFDGRTLVIDADDIGALITIN